MKFPEKETSVYRIRDYFRESEERSTVGTIWVGSLEVVERHCILKEI